MRLLGNYLSPYARRVGISLNLLELNFELETVMVFNEPEKILPHNPVARIPTLVLADDTAIGESAVMLDYLDQMVGADKALTPLSGPERLQVMQVTAIAIGATEKAQWAFYEVRFHPEEKVHQPWIDQCESRALGGLEHLDNLAKAAGDAGFIAQTDRLSQADVSTAVAFSFTDKVRPNLNISERFPSLAAYTARMEALPAFKACPIP